MNCPKCKHNNIEALEEFDIDCYEFENGICRHEFECANCTWGNTITIKILVENEIIKKSEYKFLKLPEDKELFWRVRAKNKDGSQRGISDILSFTMIMPY